MLADKLFQVFLAGSCYRISTDDNEPFTFFFSFLHLFYCIFFLSASIFYCISFLSAFSTRQKKQANQDRSGPFSFGALSNI